MGHKYKIMRPEHSSIQSFLGDKWETSVKSCGQSTQSIQSLFGDKWETRLKSCGQSTESIESLLGEETNGDKCYTSVDPKQSKVQK